MTTREDAISRIHDERADWQALLNEVGEDHMEQPGPMGNWTFKDLAGHLLGWRNRTLDLIEAGLDGSPPPPWPSNLTTDDEINQWIYDQHRDRPIADILADLDRSYDRLVRAIEAMPEDDLVTPGRFQWMEGAALIDLDYDGHLRSEHEPAIRAWLASMPQ